MRYLFLPVPAVLILGCYSPPTTEPAPAVTVTVDAPPDDVYSAVPGVLADFGWSVDAMDRASGFIRTAENVDQDAKIEGRPMSEFFDCGIQMGTPKADMYQTRIAVRVLVERTPDGAMIRPQATAENTEGATSCVSTGALERMIADAIVEAVE